MTPKEFFEFAKKNGAPQVRRPAGHLAALHPSGGLPGREGVPGRSRLRRLFDPRLETDSSGGHDGRAGSGDRGDGPVFRPAHAEHHRRRRRAAHARRVQPRPSQYRQDHSAAASARVPSVLRWLVDPSQPWRPAGPGGRHQECSLHALCSWHWVVGEACGCRRILLGIAGQCKPRPFLPAAPSESTFL